MKAVYKPGDGFDFFEEIGKIDQLCTALIGKMLPDGVHPSHFAIVLYLVRSGDGVTPLGLAQVTNVSKATISHSLKVLERRGFIETRQSPHDARSKQVYLTDAGRSLCEQAVYVAARTFNKFLHDDDRQMMSDALPGLIAIRALLEKNREPVSGDETRQRDGEPDGIRSADVNAMLGRTGRG